MYRLRPSQRPPQQTLTIINNPEPESLDPAIIVAQADMRIGPRDVRGCLTRLEPVAGPRRARPRGKLG